MTFGRNTILIPGNWIMRVHNGIAIVYLHYFTIHHDLDITFGLLSALKKYNFL